MEGEKTEPVKKVTGRSSRQDIWMAYSELLERINKKPIEPASEAKSATDLLEKLEQLKKETVQAIDIISEKATNNLDELSSARDAIAKDKAHMLGTLNEQKEALEEEIKGARRFWEREQLEKKEREGETSRQKELARREEEDEYRYSLARKRREESDKFDREMSQQREEVKREKAEIASRKAEIGDLEKEIERFPAQIDKAVKETRDVLSAELSSAHDNQNRETKLIFESKESLLNSRIANLESLSASQVKENESLKKQLSDANDRLKEMAVSAISFRSDTRKHDLEEK